LLEIGKGKLDQNGSRGKSLRTILTGYDKEPGGREISSWCLFVKKKRSSGLERGELRKKRGGKRDYHWEKRKGRKGESQRLAKERGQRRRQILPSTTPGVRCSYASREK